MTYNFAEPDTNNHFNCPVVAYYPELMRANHSGLNADNFLYPYIDINDRKQMVRAMKKALAKYNISGRAIS